MSIRIPAYAKINLFLEVQGKRENGYHDLRMVMQRISLHDDLYIRKNEQGRIRVEMRDMNDIPETRPIAFREEDNIVYRIGKALLDKYKPGMGVDITLYKRIPMQAGLGGGSSDAASVLLGLNWLFDLNLSFDELSRIGVTFGADIPFCLKGGLAAVEGIGERITDLETDLPYYTVIIKPYGGISTAEAFARFDEKKSSAPGTGDYEGFIQALKKENLSQISMKMYNDLETAAFDMSMEIKEWKDELAKAAGNALMTGSGSAVFALFDDYDKARVCFERMKRFDNKAQMFFANTI